MFDEFLKNKATESELSEALDKKFAELNLDLSEEEELKEMLLARLEAGK